MKVFRILAFLLVGLIILAQNIWASDDNALLNFRSSTANKVNEKSNKENFEMIAAKLMKLTGYTQVRYRVRDDNNDTFDIRRARLALKGDIIQRFSYKLQFEFGGTHQKLLDAELGYELDAHFKLSVGQFKIPFSLENLVSSAKLDTINRSQVVEALTARSKDVLGNQNGRDIGIKITGSFWQTSTIISLIMRLVYLTAQG